MDGKNRRVTDDEYGSSSSSFVTKASTSPEKSSSLMKGGGDDAKTMQQISSSPSSKKDDDDENEEERFKKKPPPSEKKKNTKAKTKTEKTTTLTPQRLKKMKAEALDAAFTAIRLLDDDDDATKNSTKERARALCSRKDDEEEKSILEFTVPHVPVCGAPVKVFFDAAKSASLKDNRTTWEDGVVCTVGCNEWQLGETVDVEMTQIPETSWFECTLPANVSDDAFQIDYVFKTKNGECYENNDQQNFAKETLFPRKTKRELLDEEELKRTDREDEQKAADMISRIQSSIDERQEKSFTTFEKYSRTIFETKSGDKLTQGYAKKQKIVWNKAQNPIGGYECSRLKAHVGFSNWMNGVEQVAEMRQMTPSKKYPLDENNCWFEFIVQVPKFATSVEFVVSDADEASWDNNENDDYVVAVENTNEEADWSKMQTMLADELKRKRKQAKIDAEIARQKAEDERARLKAAAVEISLKQQRHIITCEPLTPQAGRKCTVRYNKNNTNLSFAEDIYLTSGFNRWKHENNNNNNNVPEPLKMRKPKNPKTDPFYTIEIDVPSNAWMCDFVFSSGIGEGAQYDNRGGKDYHLPTNGSTEKAPPLHVINIAVEMAPIAKVGGLADVVTSLSRAIADFGHHVEIVVPMYSFFNSSPLLGAREFETNFDFGGCTITVTKCRVEGVMVFFVEPSNGMFARDAVYGWNDDASRFNFFCNAALEFLLQTGRQPDILHCHDWSSAEVARAFWENYHHHGLWKPKVAFTIHNMNYGQAKLGEAAFHSQMTTTVSPSYAGEVSGHPAVSGNLHKFHGVRNGIDSEIWNPSTDNFIPVKYDADTVVKGKKAARNELRARLGLTGYGDKPVVGVISRLTAQKGIHLIKHAAHHTLSRGGQFVLLGSAPDPKVQADFNGLGAQLGGENAGFFFAFDETLSRLMYAGCDVIVVPSMFEPCGLTQMTAMRYGTIPCVRATGGLRDTVFDVDTDKSRAAWEINASTNWETDGGDCTNGFSFEGTAEGDLDYALDRCIDAFWNDTAWFRSLQARVMRQDWTWNKPALEYIDLYYQSIGK